jgi:hypothetical protein
MHCMLCGQCLAGTSLVEHHIPPQITTTVEFLSRYLLTVLGWIEQKAGPVRVRLAVALGLLTE